MTIAASCTMTENDVLELGDYIQGQWKKLINESSRVQNKTHAWRDTDYRAQYMSGVQHWRHKPNGIVFTLAGAEAHAVELGWAPPRSSQWVDGIGTYDGEYKDLRPWLLNHSNPSVKIAGLRSDRGTSSRARPWQISAQEAPELIGETMSKTGASVYRFLKFDAPAFGEITEQTADNIIKTNKVTENDQTDDYVKNYNAQIEAGREAHKKALLRTARHHISKDRDGNITFKPIDYSHLPPAEDTFGEHVKWVYHKPYLQNTKKFKSMNQAMRFIVHKARFTVFRTITDSHQQIRRRVFFSKGIKPANLISEPTSPLLGIIRRAITNLLTGKNPEGGDKDGS
jgi:hypothetical protein